MVRFSCFNAQVDNSRPKKQAPTDSSVSSTSNPLFLKAQGIEITNSKNHASNLASVEHGRMLEILMRKSIIEFGSDREVGFTTHLKKVQSLDRGLYQEGRLHTDREDEEANPTEQCKTDKNSKFLVTLDLGHNGSIFSIRDPGPTHSHEDAHENVDTPLSGDSIDSTDRTPGSGTPALMAKADSLPNIRASALSSGKFSSKHAASRSRSSGHLNVLGMIWKDTFFNESDNPLKAEQARENNLGKTETSHAVIALQGEPTNHRWDELPNTDFKAKRIEDWVISLQHCGHLEETHESSESASPLNGDFNTMNDVIANRVDGKAIRGMEAANRYVSFLSPHATAAQLANHGLVVIPFLSAFAHLKELNLSGNCFVRITAGALPQGLHILNLSKNNISTIEGLRELIRLRILDLSYNRIHKIGHGLASCSSIKKLYLAGNKISEVEGLHRLLKLSVLDLCFNKISTAKCLGQLAANYNSLQAINLEGNPVQRNVGDEHVKKYLYDLLPHLAYYNQQHIKAGTIKDTSDRLLRFCSHQCRSDHKITVKGSHGLTAWRPSSSSTHARRSQSTVLPKLSKGRHGHLTPIATKVSTHESHPLDVDSKLLNFRENAIRKICSTGTLGDL